MGAFSLAHALSGLVIKHMLAPEGTRTPEASSMLQFQVNDAGKYLSTRTRVLVEGVVG